MAKTEFTSEQLFHMAKELLVNSQEITQAYNKIIKSISPCVEGFGVSEETYLIYDRIAVKNKEELDRIIKETKEISDWIRHFAEMHEGFPPRNVVKIDPSEWK